VVRVDDGGAGGDVVVVADVPLRHVDEVMVAEASRRVGHTGEAQIGAVGEHGRQQRRFVGGGNAGTQMQEPRSPPQAGHTHGASWTIVSPIRPIAS